jgi:hypothetical protein
MRRRIRPHSSVGENSGCGGGIMSHSALYAGLVIHQRFKPRLHRLRYRIFSLLLDLDELTDLDRRLRLFSLDRFNLFSFRQSDHGARTRDGLADWVRGQCGLAGINADGAIRVLAMPRVLGHAFNPLSVFFCHGSDGAIVAVLYEVKNTFGERHAYLIPADGAHRVIRQSCRKVFYVSPFMPMEMDYRFHVLPPGARVSVVIEGSGATGKLITASLSGRRRALSDGALLRAVLGAPAQGLKVVAGIHWEALKLWRKKLRLQPRPALPENPVTIVQG